MADNITRTMPRSEPGEKRVFICLEAGRTCPHHAHATPGEVFVVAGTYCDPGVEGGRAFAADSYRYYPPGTEHRASRPAGSGGCPVLAWNAGS